MHHDLEKVARSAHSVFSSFITSGMDHDGGDDDEMGLKEKLVFYYIERSLEVNILALDEAAFALTLNPKP